MVQRWDLITIGNLSRNRYWGEPDGQGVRPGMCTCTLITCTDGRMLVDPSIRDGEQMAAELDRRTGLQPEAIDLVYLTHGHGDHHFGLRHFPQARWLAPPTVAASLNASGQYDQPLEPVEVRVTDCCEILSTPGHTLDHTSLRFDCDGMSVVVAADAAMTRDFWAARQGYFNSADFELAAQSIDQITAVADIIVPGHDNYFVVPRGQQ